MGKIEVRGSRDEFWTFEGGVNRGLEGLERQSGFSNMGSEIFLMSASPSEPKFILAFSDNLQNTAAPSSSEQHY